MSLDTFFRIDQDGTGSVTLKQLLDAFGHDNKRVDNTLEREFDTLLGVNQDASVGIDKNEFKKFFSKSLELLNRELYEKAMNIIQYSNDNGRYLNELKKDDRRRSSNSFSEAEIIESIKSIIRSLGSNMTGNEEVNDESTRNAQLLFDKI